ncbi:RidA family protein [Pseudomonas sp. EA_15y_Pfl2_R67]|uniref:RidA family protein n=1 Tax=Pseudomonas sp. EA_15y_Pfl2_R67 TaxID=3088687 RepID=UPI00403EFF5C
MTTCGITRIGGAYQGRSRASAYRDLVWTVATATDTTQNIAEQTRQTLEIIEGNLRELGSDKQSILSAQVYIARMADKPVMDEVWCEWLGSNPQNWPQRACLGVSLEGDVLIEVTVTAVRKQ